MIVVDKIKRYIEKIIKILSIKELSILPAYLSYSLVLALIPIMTIIVVVAGIFSISIDTVGITSKSTCSEFCGLRLAK